MIARWTLTADQTNWKFNQKGQLIAPVTKNCFASDSKAALGMLNVLRLPSGKLEHLTPEIERVTGCGYYCCLRYEIYNNMGYCLDCLDWIVVYI